MKKIIAWLLVLALTAAVSIGATLAYLTDTDEDVNVMTIGKVKIDQLEYERIDTETKDEDATVQEFHDNKPLYPGVYENGFDFGTEDNYVNWDQIGKDGYESGIWNPDEINNEVDKMVFVKNKGNYDAYVRTVFAFEAGNYETLDEYLAAVHLNLNDTDWTWEWTTMPVEIGESTYFVATATYNKVLEPGTITEISLSQIALNKTTTNEDVEAFGDTYQVLVKSQAIQADGFNNAAVALDEGFGVIAANSLPWENDSPIAGATAFNALHYLDADPAGTNIKTKVANITFGLNKDYANITGNYTGTLVDVEQDVPVYAYYVPNGSNYDVYLLANDAVYAPVDSTSLFEGMTALTSVDVSNLDVSRVETMLAMFKGCTALTAIDLTGWDTGKVTNTKTMFYNCSNLTTLTGISDLDMSSVEDMYGMFSGCKKLVELDITDWDVSKVVTMKGMFNACTNLQTLGAANWDTGNADSFSAMFQGCNNLKNIDVSNWDTSKVTNMEHMFAGCKSLEELDVSKWNVSNVQKFNAMFQGGGSNAFDMKLTELDLSNWTPNSATHLNHMFYGCAKLTELDLSDWNMPNLYTTSHMFADCSKLATIDVSGWQTSEAWYSMDAMFNDCQSVKFLDVSSFTTSGVVEFSQIFEKCTALEQIKGLENWDTSNGKNFDQTFLSCHSVKVLNLSSFDTRNATKGNVNINGDKSSGFSSMFSGVNSLETLILGENFDFNGDGTVSANVSLPNPVKIDGQETKWYNAENDTYYTASEIPAETAATYVAAVPPANP